MNAFPGLKFLVPAMFAFFVATTVAGALIAALSGRVIRGVCGLAMCCIGLAGLFYFLHSPFLALMEILIYVGAVCVTVVFVIMLAEPEESAQEEKRRGKILWGGTALLVSAAVFLGLSRLGVWTPWASPPATVADGSVKAIGVSLLTTYSMAFELISLVLLVAIVGALAVARGGRSRA
jgi:NADH:ubiquinone oxidoreductase subunit 6 (subunit J)